jgi:superfamily II RNA helicase
MVRICSTDYPIENDEKYRSHFDVFPYELSPFQKHSIEAIIEGNHALVCAPTGSGKTLPGEFAIQYFVNQGKKLFYCSPIKALSNQKYYEFSKKYPHIKFGLRTGDISCNPDADVVICTTEVLMNFLFLYNKDEPNATTLDFNVNVEQELACVIFDEVHYINDAERGKNWEKTIIMLPPHVQLVMLSATIDNPKGFAEWIETGRYGGGKGDNDGDDFKKVYLASTTHRIVPLTHYCFLTTTEGIFKGMKDKDLEKQIRDNTNKILLLQDEKGKFNETAVQTIAKMGKIFETKQVYMKRQQVLNSVLLHLRDKDMLPAIAFVFSRKHVELCAKEVTIPLLEDDSKIPYTIRRECEQIIRKLPNFQEYLELPEYNSLVSLLEKGIGIHHSGMQTVLREIVELMISKKYIKLLFATESFSIGLDCPIRTAIFTSLKKFDGLNERYLFPHEYTQSAGRAGRRSIDTVGHVVHLNNLFDLPSMTEYKQILCGKPQKLVSKFHISYAVILNLIKNGQTTGFSQFSEKSMMQDELLISVNQQKNHFKELVEKLNIKSQSLSLLKTPYDICMEYKRIEDSYKLLINKKRKDAERTMKQIQDEYKTIHDDVKKVNDYLSIKDEMHDEVSSIEYTETFIQSQTNKIIDVMSQNNFITKIDDTDNYCFTELGTIASCIAEIHPLIISKVMRTTNYFEGFSTKQLIGLLSIFTDVKVPQDQKSIVPNTDDGFLKKHIKEIDSLYLFFSQLEMNNDLRTGLKYEDAIIYDMIDFSMQWCECDNEHDCKYFIQNVVAEKQISIGDFNKAMLKIVTISKELINVCEVIGQIELMSKLTNIESKVLKYVTTSQSLYV